MQVTTELVAAGGLLLLVLGGFASALALLMRRFHVLGNHMRSELALAREELARVSAQGLRIANQQHAVEAQLRQVAERQGQLELRGEGRPFEQAIEMLRGGATREDLVARFGLSDSEVALLVQLHSARHYP